MRSIHSLSRLPIAPDPLLAERLVIRPILGEPAFSIVMLTVAADRQHLTSHAHAPDTKWQVEFEQSFLYRETPDQLRCVEEIKRDMEKAKELAQELDDLLTQRISGFSKYPYDPNAVQTRHVFIFYRKLLWEIMDAAGISHCRV